MASTERFSRERSLDQDLERYAASATQRIARAGQKAAGWLPYAAAAGATLAMAPAADAIVIHSGPQNLMLNRGPGLPGGTVTTQVLNLDLDGDGVNDFFFEVVFERFDSVGNPSDADAGVYIHPFGANSVLYSSTSYYLARLAASDYIPTAGYLTSTSGLLRYADLDIAYGSVTSFSASGNFAPSQAGFIGVQFAIGPNRHNGWIQVHVGADGDGLPNKLTIIDWAFENQPGTEIHAGDTGARVPAPAAGGLMLLGLGALGLREWRRRRRERQPDA